MAALSRLRVVQSQQREDPERNDGAILLPAPSDLHRNGGLTSSRVRRCRTAAPYLLPGPPPFFSPRTPCRRADPAHRSPASADLRADPRAQAVRPGGGTSRPIPTLRSWTRPPRSSRTALTDPTYGPEQQGRCSTDALSLSVLPPNRSARLMHSPHCSIALLPGCALATPDEVSCRSCPGGLTCPIGGSEPQREERPSWPM